MRAIRIVRIYPDAKVPVRASDGAIGFDVFAYHVLDKETKAHQSDLPISIDPGQAILFGVGVKFAVHWGYEVQVRPRSGLANKHDIELSNSPGTVDPDFRGELGCLLRNRGESPFVVEKGMRIAQLIFSKVETPQFDEVENEDDLGETARGIGGFGSTGLMGEGMGTLNYDDKVKKTDIVHMRMVLATSEFSNCMRGCKKDDNGNYVFSENGISVGQKRKFGCLIVQDPQQITRRIVASGYNCQYPGSKLCAEVGCLRDELNIPSGEKIEICRAVHAEQAAFLSAASTGSSIEGATMYVNSEPCQICAKEIAMSGISTLVVLQENYGDGKRHGLNIVREAGVEIRIVLKEEL